MNTLVRFIIEDCGLKVIHRTRLSMVRGTDEKRLPIPLEYALAMQLSEKLALRALDLLHVAYMSLLRDEVEVFVTGDEELLEAGKKIKELVGIEVCSIQELP